MANLSPKKICILSNKGWLLHAESDQRQIGGAEVQEYILSKNLAKKGWRVVLLCEKLSNVRLRPRDGISILPIIHVSQKGHAPFQIFETCLTIWIGIQRSKCQILYQRNPNRYSGIIAVFCRLLRKKFIIAGAHDRAFYKNRSRHMLPATHLLSFRLGIALANTIIVQNAKQKELVRKNYGRNSIVFHNVFNGSDLAIHRKHILWIAGLMEWKRPELFIKLADDNPDYEFVMVGSPRHTSGYLETLRSLGTGIMNLRIYGHQPFETADALFVETLLFVNTSTSEGFPNTFLQAWRRGVPVLSFVDPDGLISTKNLGAVAKNYSDMNRKLKMLLSAPDYDERAKSIYETFNEIFCVSKAIRTFETILRSK